MSFFGRLSRIFRPRPAVFVPGSAPLLNVEGVDVSRYQGEVSWSEVSRAGVRFAVVKATEGADYLSDPERLGWFQRTYNGAHFASPRLAVQVYHYARPDVIPRRRTPVQDAMDEALSFLSALNGQLPPTEIEWSPGRSCSVWLDAEEKVPDLGPADGLSWILAWLAEVEVHYPVGIYSKEEWLFEELGRDLSKVVRRPNGKTRPLWVARYGVNDGRRHNVSLDRKVPDEWGTADLWQYTSRGRVPGVSKPTDRNLAFRFLPLRQTLR